MIFVQTFHIQQFACSEEPRRHIQTESYQLLLFDPDVLRSFHQVIAGYNLVLLLTQFEKQHTLQKLNIHIKRLFLSLLVVLW
jgi:hypothetical protein